MSLIRGLDRSPLKQKLLSSIVSLCHELGIQMIAEGIETEAERDMLVAGWRPVPGLFVRAAPAPLGQHGLPQRRRHGPRSRLESRRLSARRRARPW
jgi:predicted signal transduction protein with EAL and GGDEF domain